MSGEREKEKMSVRRDKKWECERGMERKRGNVSGRRRDKGGIRAGMGSASVKREWERM